MELGGSDALDPIGGCRYAGGSFKVALNSAVSAERRVTSCIGAKRFIILKEAEAAFSQEFLNQLKNLKQGDPFDKKYQHRTPMARPDLVEALEKQLHNSVKKGARLE